MHIKEDSGKFSFNRIYVCLNALKVWFKNGCRKIIALDGTFLKGPHPRILLTTVGIDANNGIYPVAYAVVEGENKATWRWIMQFLIRDRSIEDSEEWSLILDRQKG